LSTEVRQAAAAGAIPVAFTTDVNSQTGKNDVLDRVILGLNQGAENFQIPNINGENAILGNSVVSPANIIGTMLSVIPKGNPLPNSHEYAVFDPEGKLVYINNDGVGTKTRIYERLVKLYIQRLMPNSWGELARALYDSAAMKLDDLIKLGATAMVVSDVVETKGDIPVDMLRAAAKQIGEKMGFQYILNNEAADGRIRGFNDDVFSYNLGGGAVSVIDEARLRNPLRPSEGEWLLALTRGPNGRSNGFTARREIMEANYGADWHLNPECAEILEFLAMPSVVFYPAIKATVDNGTVTSFYHMSGKSFDGKLAKPLADHGLYARLDHLFEPCEAEIRLVQMDKAPMEKAYRAFCMGNDGFVTTKDCDKAVAEARNQGFDARVVARLERRPDGVAGVELTAYNGQKVQYHYQKAA